MRALKKLNYVKELRIQEEKFMFLKKLKLGILVQKQLMMNFLMKWNFREIGIGCGPHFIIIKNIMVIFLL